MLSGRPGIFYLPRQVERFPRSVLVKDLFYFTGHCCQVEPRFLSHYNNKIFFYQTKSSYSYLVEFSATWQQCILERVKIPRQV